MTSDDSLRTAEALARFEAALGARGHPLAGMLSPGLGDDEIASTMQPTGLTLPAAAAALWRWRDGVAAQATADLGRVPGSEFTPGGILLPSLSHAVEVYLDHLENFPWGDLDDCSPSWFPIGLTGHADTLWVDCAGPASGRVIYRKGDDYNTPEDLARNTLPSLAEVIDRWTAMLTGGEFALVDGAWQLTRQWQPGRPTWY